MDDAISNFVAFTDSTPEIARRYLTFAENNFEQAVQLFFDSPDLATAGASPTQAAAPSNPARSQAQSSNIGRQDASGVVHLDSDDEEMDLDNDSDDDTARAAALSRAADLEDDEAMARRIQEEMYAGGDGGGDFDADGVRAPIARRTETLVGGPDDDFGGHDYMNHAIAQQMRARHTASSGRPGVFNQRATPAARSIWEEPAGESARRQELAQATGGASEVSNKAARLAELFRPPFDMMNQLAWDEARDLGKEEMKWIIVNIQDPSIFDCQSLNRDIWKDPGVRDLVKENFIFMQYSKDDPRGGQYINYYFPLRDSQAAYPHIAIVDPRTGEQVKIWSGPPVPKAGDFLMQLVEFLDRYSLDLSKTNPVARRKADKPKSFDVDRLTEQEMLDLALQNSLNNSGGAGPKETDPDELTKSPEKTKGKGKEVEEDEEAAEATISQAVNAAFAEISSSNPHAAPAVGSPGTTRIQFRHPTGRVVRVFDANDTVRRMYEWLKAEPLEGKEGVVFELKGMGKDLIEYLDETIEDAGLKNGTVMVEFLED